MVAWSPSWCLSQILLGMLVQLGLQPNWTSDIKSGYKSLYSVRLRCLRRRCCCARSLSPRWKPAAPTARTAVYLSEGPPRGWPSPRCRSPSQPGWWLARGQRHACRSGGLRSPHAPCSCLESGKWQCRDKYGLYCLLRVLWPKEYIFSPNIWN